MTSLNESPSNGSTSIVRKRKISADEAGGGRVVKHRSSQACQSCRTRKVRCDVLANGSRCTNCRLDHMECVVVASRRGKTNHSYRNSIVQSITPPQSVRVLGESTPNTTKNDRLTGHDPKYTPEAPSDAGPVPTCVTFDEDPDKARSVNDNTRNGTERAPSEPYDGVLIPEPGTSSSNQYQSPPGLGPLPAFITPMSSRILSEDLDFLERKGALTIPDPELRVEILRSYMFSIHPIMPMLSHRHFISAVLNNREDGRISLLLFQAVMFAGLTSLQLDVVHRMGFKSVKQARKVFFDRVRLLYEFDVETDSAAVLQSLILMSLWYGKWDDRRHTWHWTGLAYDVARSMGLHREPTKKASDKVRHFRRRLWWSLYIRDRMIALGTRRPMRICDDDFNVAMLTLQDFDLETFEQSSQGHCLIPSAEDITSTALMCIQLAKLCTYIGHVMSSQYTVVSTHPDVPHTMMVVSKRNGGNTQELESCDRELDEWFRALSTNVRRTTSTNHQEDPHSCSEAHWACLNLAYLTVVNVLHRAQALQPLPTAAEAQIVQKQSRAKVKDAARSLTKLAQNMLRNDQIRFLSPLGVTALMAASLSHMLDISSGDEDVRDASTFRLYQSLQVLQSLGSIYSSADAAVSFLTSVTRKAGIPVPAEVSAPAADTESENPKHRTRKDSNGWILSNQQPNTLTPTWHSQPYPYSSTNHHPLLNRLPHPNTHLPTPVNGTISPSAVALASSKTSSLKDTPSAEHRIEQFVDAAFGGLINPPAGDAMFDWNSNGVGVEADGDLDSSMAFNYDFYSDAFGFLDGALPGL